MKKTSSMTHHSTSAALPHVPGRGIKSCLATGWRFLATHPLGLLRAMTPALLIGGIGFAACIAVFTQLYNSLIVPVRTAIFLGVPADEAWMEAIPSLAQVGMALGALLFFFVTTQIMGGSAWRLAIVARKSDSLPKERLRPALSHSWRIIYRLAIYSAVLALPVLFPDDFCVGAGMVAFLDDSLGLTLLLDLFTGYGPPRSNRLFGRRT